jgi:serine/threonine-protein kinase
MIGASLGAYRITGKLGEGGMGEVYRARDTKLSRDVALKILPASLATDADRLARFKREAQVLASLNHSNIAQIYGLEDSTATHALVLELVDGPTLADRIASGPMAVADALPIARQIAEALEAAHEQGIIHRDLKPANVKVRPDGTVKVLDFGLAKALAANASSAIADAMSSPTVTTPAMTALGVILGTAAYMSPEQAKGRAADKRADIWAFGVVLFEMLAGRPLFAGDSVVETIGLVATRDPDWSQLPASTPGSVRRLLARCLTRDPRHRLRDIGEARIALAGADAGETDAATPAQLAAAPAVRWRALWIAGAAALAAIAVAVGWYLGSRDAPASSTTAPPFQAEIVPTPADAFGRFSSQRVFTFTPDGRALIYASTDPTARLLYRRDREASAAVPIAGTEGAYGPFVSPDSVWVGFFADGRMKRVPIGGGAPQTIHDMRSATAPDALGFGWSNEVGPGREMGYGAAWLPDDSIVYGRFVGGLWRISVTGGPPTPLTTSTSEGEVAHRLPQALPGGRAIVFTAVRGLLANQGSSVEAIDLVSGTRTTLMNDATDGRYAAGGHLLFARSGALYSIQFDAATLQTSGEPVRISDDVMHAIGGGSPGRASGVAQYDVSIDGTLAVLRGGTIATTPRQLVWVSAGGKIDPLPLDPAPYLGPRLSPDGAQIALTTNTELLIIGVRDGISTPLARHVIFPVWTADGSRVLVGARGTQVPQDIQSLSLSGGAPETIVTGPHPLWPSSVSRDGRFLAYVESNPKTGNDIWVAGLAPKSPPVAVMTTPASETHPTFSPDGQWLMYAVGDGDASGVYVRQFPGPGRVERIAREGASTPIWAHDGKSILYESTPSQPNPASRGARQITRVPIDTSGDRVRIGSAEVFATMAFASSTPVSGFEISRDQRVLATMTAPRPAGADAVSPALQLTLHANLARAARK